MRRFFAIAAAIFSLMVLLTSCENASDVDLAVEVQGRYDVEFLNYETEAVSGGTVELIRRRDNLIDIRIRDFNGLDLQDITKVDVKGSSGHASINCSKKVDGTYDGTGFDGQEVNINMGIEDATEMELHNFKLVIKKSGADPVVIKGEGVGQKIPVGK